MIGVRCARVLAFVLCVCGTLHATTAQTVRLGPIATKTYTNPLGFSFAYPATWEAVPLAAAPMTPKRIATAKAEHDISKRIALCVDRDFQARGLPTVVGIFIFSVPFSCLGVGQSPIGDLKSFGVSFLNALGGKLDLTSSLGSPYTSGTHRAWAGLAHGGAKGRPDFRVTVEAACAILKRGVVCVAGASTEPDSVSGLANGIVTLDNDPPTVLVPPTAFAAAETGA